MIFSAKRLLLYGCAGWLLVLAGCSSAPQRLPDELVNQPPPFWLGDSAHQAVAEHWLSQFNDPALTALVAQALQDNFDLQAGAAGIKAAQLQARIDGAGRLPQLNFAPAYRSEGDNSNGHYGAFELLFNFSWEFDVWGRIRAAQDAGWQDAAASAADWQAARLSLAARVAQTYFDLTEAKLQIQVAEQSINDRRLIAELVKGRFNRGLTRGLDLRMVMTDLANAEAQLASARNQVQLLSRRLAVLLARYPDEQLQGRSALPELPAQLAAGLPAELLLRRPDLQSALAQIKAADLRLESAEKALLPRITLTAGGGSRSSALGEIIDPRAAAWNLASGLVQPILNGGRLNNDITRHQALVEQALARYRSVALTAFREVEQALASEEKLRQQEQALAEAVKQTEESRKLAVYAYRQGLIEILTLLDSYRSLLNARSAHLTVQKQLLNNRIALYLALGGAA